MRLSRNDLDILEKKEVKRWKIISRSNWLAYGENIPNISTIMQVKGEAKILMRSWRILR